MGIAGIVSVLLIIFSTFRVLSRSEKNFKAINNQKLYYLTMGLKTAFVGMLLHLAMRGDQTTILLWILIGLSWVTYNIAMEVKMKNMCKSKIICAQIILFLAQTMFSCASSVGENLINRTKENLKIIESLLEKEKQKEKNKDLEELIKVLEESRQLVREEKWDKARRSLNHILYTLNSRHEKWRKTALTKLSLAKNMIELRTSEGKDIKQILPLMKKAIDSIENLYNFQEASKYLDQVLVLLRENKPEEEKKEILPFTPDTVNRMFTRLKLIVDIKETQGEDMNEIKKMAQKALKLAQKEMLEEQL